jgi:FkbM family methyltransferase
MRRFVELLRAIVRAVLSVYYRDGKIYRMPLGPLRGLRVRYRPDLTFHNVLGLKDVESFRALSRIQATTLKDTRTICDIGAQFGLYSLWFGRAFAADDLAIHAFEPSPATFERLRDNLEINGMKSVIPVRAACSSASGTTQFFVRPSSSTSSLLNRDEEVLEQITVQTVSLDDYFLSRGQPSPELLKIDVEGAGAFVLEGASQVLRAKRPVIVFDSHSPEEDSAVSNLCLTLKYGAYRITDDRWVTQIAETHPNREGVWGALLLIPSEKEQEARRLLG